MPPSLPAGPSRDFCAVSGAPAPAVPTLCAVLFPPAEAPAAPRGRHRRDRSSNVSPAARVVHPRGFRVLKETSAVERSLRSYFRLPPAPSARLAEERRRVARALCAAETREEEDALCFVDDDAQSRVLLDGFRLLCAAGTEEPDAVTNVTLQSSQLVGVIEDDLAFFTELRFLDVSENALRVEQLLRLTGLEELHMTYNGIQSLEGIRRAAQAQAQAQLATPNTDGPLNTTGNASVRSAAAYYAQEQTQSSVHDGSVGKDADKDKDDTEDDAHVRNIRSTPLQFEAPSDKKDGRHSNCGYYSPHARMAHWGVPVSEVSKHDVLLPQLHALNLSFNRIPPMDILHLSYFPFLEKLDLSGNGLRTLPEDLAELTSVTHLALERNKLCDGGAVFAALSTMPALIEVNLNHNRLCRVPPLSVRDGRGLCFPTIEVIGLTHNCIRSVQDVAALAELVRTLQRVVLSGNPIALKTKERAAVQEHFAHAVLGLYWEQAGICKTPYTYTHSNSHLKGKNSQTEATGKQKDSDTGTSLAHELSGTVETSSGDTSLQRADDASRKGYISQLWRSQQRKQHKQQHKQHEEERPDLTPIKKGSNGAVTRAETDGGALTWSSSFSPYLSLRQQNELYHDESDDAEGRSGIRDASVLNEFLEANGSFHDEDVFLEGLLEASALEWSAQELNQARDVHCNSVDEPFFRLPHVEFARLNKSRLTQKTTPTDDTAYVFEESRNAALPKLPTPSLLRFVDIIFEDDVMPKQKTGYFYANRWQRAAEAGEKEFPRVSSMIHPRTGFVTVPKYNEFMDIYKSLDKSQQPLRSGKRRKSFQRRTVADIVLPPEEEEDEKEEEEVEEVELEETVEHDKFNESGQETSPQDFVFMTGVTLEGEPKHTAETPKECPTKPRVARRVNRDRAKSEPVGKKDVKIPKKPEESQKTKFQRKVVSVERPPATNVRILMNELRTMLRRPLPPLPSTAVRPREKGKR